MKKEEKIESALFVTIETRQLKFYLFSTYFILHLYFFRKKNRVKIVIKMKI